MTRVMPAARNRPAAAGDQPHVARFLLTNPLTWITVDMHVDPTSLEGS